MHDGRLQYASIDSWPWWYQWDGATARSGCKLELFVYHCLPPPGEWAGSVTMVLAALLTKNVFDEQNVNTGFAQAKH